MLMISPACRARRRRSLRKEERRGRFAHEVVPLRRRDAADRRRVEGRSVVDQHVESPVALQRRVDQRRQRVEIAQIAGYGNGRARSRRVQPGDQRRGFVRGTPVMYDDRGTRRVQPSRDRAARGAAPPRMTRTQ